MRWPAWLVDLVARDVVEANRALELQNAVLVDRGERLDHDVKRLIGELADARRNETQALKMQINLDWQSKGAGALYMDAPHLPAVLAPRVQNPSDAPLARPSGSQLIAQHESKFRREYDERRKRAMAEAS